MITTVLEYRDAYGIPLEEGDNVIVSGSTPGKYHFTRLGVVEGVSITPSGPGPRKRRRGPFLNIMTFTADCQEKRISISHGTVHQRVVRLESE